MSFGRRVPAGTNSSVVDNLNPQIYFLDQRVRCQLSHFILMNANRCHLSDCKNVQAFPRTYLQIELDECRRYEQCNTEEDIYLSD